MLVAVGCIAACVATQDDAPTSADRSTSVAPPAGDPASTRTTPLAQGRIVDWSFDRVTDPTIRGLPPQPQTAPDDTPKVDWNVTTGSPVTAAPAVYGAVSSSSPTDKLFFAVNGTSGITGGASATASGSNVFALTNLYTATPTLLWSVSVSGGVDRAAPVLSLDGTKVYFVDTGGTLHCYQTGVANPDGGANTGGAKCTGWTNYASGHNVHGSSPWIDYAGTGDIYFGDDSAYVQRVNGTTGAPVWQMQPGPSGTYQGAFESSPVVIKGYIYIGDDLGQLFRLTDSTSGPTAGSSTVAIFNTCSAIGTTAPCPNGTAWAVRAGIGYDVTNDRVYAVANNYVFELQSTSGSFSPTSSSPKFLNTTSTGPMYSAPVLDHTNGYVYTSFGGKVFKIAYPFSGSSTSNISSTALYSGTNPSSYPLPYNYGSTINAVYAGDPSGYVERFDCLTQAGPLALDGVTNGGADAGNYGTGIGTPPVLDYVTGDVNFGYSGGLVQYPLAVGSYGCPPSAPKLCTTSPNNCLSTGGSYYGDACRGCCSNSDCSGATPECVGGTCQAACVTASNCASLPNTTAACTSGACVYTCTTNYANCDDTLTTNGCNVNTQTDPNNCGGCGTACSNTNIPVPLCTAGVCGGHCQDGYIHCASTGTRQAKGCETSAACGNCCGSACASGSTCYDTGSGGACATGQLTNASGTTSEHGTATATCPSGQKISSVLFADFGTPDGNTAGGPNFSPCSGATSSATCSSSTLTGYNCTWNSGSSTCTGPVCWDDNTQSTCGTGCTWTGGKNTSQSTAAGICTTAACAAATSSTACTAISGCAWDTALSLCTANLGFLHEYGTYTPNCALDISTNSVTTAACVTTASSCSLLAQDGTYGSGTNPTSPTSLPLTGTAPSDPCPSIYKRLYLEVQCGTCGGPVTAYADAAQAGSEPYSFPLGMDFSVTTGVTISKMGVFDSNQDGLKTPVTVAIWSNGTTPAVISGTTVTFSGTTAGLGTSAGSGATTVSGGDRFFALTSPVVLPAGNYSVVAYGYSASELTGNAQSSSWVLSTENTGGGAITFTGKSRYASGAPGGTFPTTIDAGPTNRYGAGTFIFE